MSSWSNPRLGMGPLIGENVSISSVRFSSRNRSCGLSGKWGRQIVLKPVPCQVPTSWSSGLDGTGGPGIGDGGAGRAGGGLGNCRSS